MQINAELRFPGKNNAKKTHMLSYFACNLHLTNIRIYASYGKQHCTPD